jgi:cation diffusion facilitator CzcD-associated flavoprotein CzcO
VRLRPAEGCLRAEVEQDGAAATLWARTIVLATGIEGNGVRRVPAFISDHLPKAVWAHSHEAIDFAALAGKRVAVLGGGASAFDAAIAAAEQGAPTDLCHRDTHLVAANATAWGEFNGYLAHYPDMSLLDRWRFTQKLRRFKTGPPVRTMERAARLANLTVHPGCGWRSARLAEGRVRIEATDGVHVADYLILGTGYVTDVSIVEELAEHAPLMAQWRDVFTPPAGEEDPSLASAPFLGPHFEVQEKVPGTAPWLQAVFNFSRGGSLSMGAMPIGLSGIKFGVPRLVHGVTKRLFLEDVPGYFEGMKVWLESDKMLER